MNSSNDIVFLGTNVIMYLRKKIEDEELSGSKKNRWQMTLFIHKVLPLLLT